MKIGAFDFPIGSLGFFGQKMDRTIKANNLSNNEPPSERAKPKEPRLEATKIKGVKEDVNSTDEYRFYYADQEVMPLTRLLGVGAESACRWRRSGMPANEWLRKRRKPRRYAHYPPGVIAALRRHAKAGKGMMDVARAVAKEYPSYDVKQLRNKLYSMERRDELYGH